MAQYDEQPAVSAGGSAPNAATVPPAADDAGERIGPYRLLQPIGQGGMGTVYLAEQEEPVRRRVALKLIRMGMDTRQVIARFDAERQALAMMDHPNIARALDAGTSAAGRPYFVMELVQGVPITRYCDAHCLPPRRRLELFIPVCRALQHAHQKGIIHRDVKPSNVLVADVDGRPLPKVIDFGVAKALHQPLTDQTLFTYLGVAVGTLEYMSPEQADADVVGVDTRADVYSLGVMLYELLTGSVPFAPGKLRDAGWAGGVRMIKEVDPPRPSTRLAQRETDLAAVSARRGLDPQRLRRTIHGDLDWVVMRCLEKDRGRRYESAGALAQDLERHLADEPVEARPPSAGYRVRKFVRRHRVGVLSGAAIVLLLVAGVVVSTWQAVRATRAEARALATKREAEQRGAEAMDMAGFLTTVCGRLDASHAGGEAGPVAAALDEIRKELTAGKGASRGRLLNALGQTYHTLGLYARAYATWRDARAVAGAEWPDDDLDALMCQNNLGVAEFSLGRYEAAEATHRATLERRLKLFGPDDPATLTSRHNLGVAVLARGRVAEAAALHAETLRLRVARLGPDEPATLNSRNHLAEAYRAQGRLDEALAMHRETLTLREAKLAPSHPDTLTSLYNLAETCRAMKRFDEAVARHEQAHGQRRARLGPAHPATAASRVALITLYREIGDVAKAEELERTLDVTVGK